MKIIEKRIRKAFIFLMLIVFLLPGCSTTPDRTKTRPYLRASDLVSIYHFLEMGKTDEEYVLQRLGEPNFRAEDQLKREVWVYMDDEFPARLILRIAFKEGIVDDYSLDSLGDDEEKPRTP